MHHLQKTDRNKCDFYSKTRLAERQSAYSKSIHNFYSHVFGCKILVLPKMNSNAFQTKLRFLNPRKVLDVQAKWGIGYPFQELHVCRYPKEQKGECQKRLQNWECRADIHLDSSTHSASQLVLQTWHFIVFYFIVGVLCLEILFVF